MTLDRAAVAAIRRYTAGVLRARAAYTPDRILWADDCRIPGCTRPATARGGTCRGHRHNPEPAILPSDRRVTHA